jgi:hypothetical protein
MSDLKQYEEAHNLRQKESLDAAIELALAKQGIDPERVPKRDFDQIRRLNIKLNDINAKAQAHIAKVQQEAGLEYNTTILELNQISLNLKIAQGVVPAPQVLEDQPVATGGPVIETPVEKRQDESREAKDGKAPGLEAQVPETPKP